jgi:hypothetical protein
MESYLLCCTCGSLEYSAIDVDLCTRCDRRYCSAHRRTHRCDDSQAPQLSPVLPRDVCSPTEGRPHDSLSRNDDRWRTEPAPPGPEESGMKTEC